MTVEPTVLRLVIRNKAEAAAVPVFVAHDAGTDDGNGHQSAINYNITASLPDYLAKLHEKRMINCNEISTRRAVNTLLKCSNRLFESISGLKF
jgi:hypothetical protein